MKAASSAVRSAKDVIRTTDNHPFYVKGKGWVHASDLMPGDLLRDHNGRYVRVRKTVDTGKTEPVFNLHVEGKHTYFVMLPQSGQSVLVHNDSSYLTLDPNAIQTTVEPITLPSTPVAPSLTLDQSALTTSVMSSTPTPMAPQTTTFGSSAFEPATDFAGTTASDFTLTGAGNLGSQGAAETSLSGEFSAGGPAAESAVFPEYSAPLTGMSSTAAVGGSSLMALQGVGLFAPVFMATGAYIAKDIHADAEKDFTNMGNTLINDFNGTLDAQYTANGQMAQFPQAIASTFAVSGQAGISLAQGLGDFFQNMSNFNVDASGATSALQPMMETPYAIGQAVAPVSNLQFIGPVGEQFGQAMNVGVQMSQQAPQIVQSTGSAIQNAANMSENMNNDINGLFQAIQSIQSPPVQTGGAGQQPPNTPPSNVASAGGDEFHDKLEQAIVDEFTVRGDMTAEAIRVVGISNPHQVANLDPSLGSNQVRYQVSVYNEATGEEMNVSVGYEPATGRFGTIKPSSIQPE